jgi:hypothetical protein
MQHTMLSNISEIPPLDPIGGSTVYAWAYQFQRQGQNVPCRLIYHASYGVCGVGNRAENAHRFHHSSPISLSPETRNQKGHTRHSLCSDSLYPIDLSGCLPNSGLTPLY